MNVKSFPCRAFCPVLCLILLSSSGCGKGYEGEKLHPVSITVKDEGKSVDGAVVILLRQGGESVNVSGLTDGSGTARMKVDSEWPGAPVGTYTVKISKSPAVPHELSPEEMSKLGLKEREEYDIKIAAKMKDQKPVIPSTVSGSDSPLTITVEPKGNVITFDIAEYWQ